MTPLMTSLPFIKSSFNYLRHNNPSLLALITSFINKGDALFIAEGLRKIVFAMEGLLFELLSNLTTFNWWSCEAVDEGFSLVIAAYNGRTAMTFLGS